MRIVTAFLSLAIAATSAYASEPGIAVDAPRTYKAEKPTLPPPSAATIVDPRFAAMPGYYAPPVYPGMCQVFPPYQPGVGTCHYEVGIVWKGGCGTPRYFEFAIVPKR